MLFKCSKVWKWQKVFRVWKKLPLPTIFAGPILSNKFSPVIKQSREYWRYFQPSAVSSGITYHRLQCQVVISQIWTQNGFDSDQCSHLKGSLSGEPASSGYSNSLPGEESTLSGKLCSPQDFYFVSGLCAQIWRSFWCDKFPCIFILNLWDNLQLTSAGYQGRNGPPTEVGQEKDGCQSRSCSFHVSSSRL